MSTLDKSKKNYGKSEKRTSGETANAGNNGTSDQKLGPNLNFAAREAYNLLRTNLTFSLADKKGKGKIVGVTSPNAQEGKSHTSINLAYALAEAGNKVLLIDGDLRRPSIARVLGKRNAPGLSNFLIGNTDSTVRSGLLHENLNVMTAGDIPPNPSELLGSEVMGEALDFFSQHFEYIILDLPPVNTVSDPLVACRWVDGVILVVRHGITHRSEAAEAVHQLQFAKANILGFVYNARTHRSSGYYKYKYKRYGKYSGYSNYGGYGTYGGYGSYGNSGTGKTEP